MLNSTATIRCGLLLLLGGLTFTGSAQTTYYVASNGNDSSDGRSLGSPFQSLGKINSLTLQPGDQVLFRRGDTFRGTLSIRQSGSAAQPIVFDAYGSGAKPILSGAVPVSNWTSLGNNRWQATCPSCGDRVTGLYWDNAVLPLGRYPNLSDSNKGYLTVQSHSGKTQLTSQQSLGTNWTGGEAVFRPVQWILNRATITGQNGNALSLDGSGTYDISDNWGYFIQNHPATLDQTGEWYYNPSNKTIQLFDNQSNPNNQSITATVYAEALNLTNQSNITIRNLQLTQALSTNLLINSGSNLVISSTDITKSGEDGLLIQGSGQQVLLENNLVEDINNNGVNIGYLQNVTVRGNTIRRIGLTPGRGKSGDGTYVGFRSSTTANTLIENNVLDNIGYNALNYSTNTTIQRNQISNFCLTKSDGSGLYIWNGNKEALSGIRVLSNIVYNGIGAPEGTPGGAYSGANGIYLDDCTTNIEVGGNTVYNCRGLGIYLHGSNNVRVTGNTVYNNGEGQLAITSAGGCQPNTNLIQNNIFVSRLANQFNVKYESTQNDLGNFGQFDNNVYARPFEDTYKIRAVYNNTTGADLSLAQWQSRYGKDLTTASSPITYSSGNPDDYIKIVANPSGNAIQTSLDGTYRDARNTVYTNQLTLAPFSSLVLFKETNPSPTPPPTNALRSPDNPANSTPGLDFTYYEGSWTSLPNFATLTPSKTGTTATPTLAIRSRDDNFGLRFGGFVSVPTDGLYTFYCSSDDGSKLLIGSTEVVNNDGGHPQQERSGSIGLKAGVHALTVLYYEGGGDQALTVSYSGPGIGKQTIPAAAYFRVATASAPQPPASTVGTGSGTGLRAEYYNNKDLTAPLALTRTDATIDFDWGAGSPAPNTLNIDNFSVRWSGQLEAPTSGNYSFSTLSDDGVRLWVNDKLVIDNWTGHAPTTNTSASVSLQAGQKYALRMEYYEGPGGAVARLLWSYPGQSQQVIPQARLYPAAGSGRVGVVSNRETATEELVVVYPVPARDELRIRYQAAASGEATIQMVNALGRVIMESQQLVEEGGNDLRFDVKSLPRGLHILSLTQGPLRFTRKVILTE